MATELTNTLQACQNPGKSGDKNRVGGRRQG